MSENTYIRNEVEEFCERQDIQHLRVPILTLVANLCFSSSVDSSIAEEAEYLVDAASPDELQT